MVHPYINISITKTTTYAIYLRSLIVLLVRRNERNVGLGSLFHALLISKEPMHSSFFPFQDSLDHLQHHLKSRGRRHVWPSKKIQKNSDIKKEILHQFDLNK